MENRRRSSRRSVTRPRRGPRRMLTELPGRKLIKVEEIPAYGPS